MNEEYGSTSFIRRTEDPTRAKRGSNPKKARYTGLSIASLRENINTGALVKKIEKYNDEYKKLLQLAVEVNEGRAELDATDEANHDAVYTVVADSIKKYNAQARRLAEIGVNVLFFDTENKKIELAKGNTVKAIRVPGFLFKYLRMLTAAGREKAKEEKNIKMQKQANEKAMYDAIVSTAQEAVGEKPEDTIDVQKMEDLSIGSLADTLNSAFNLDKPSVDLPKNTSVDTPESERVSPAENVGKTEAELAAEEAARVQAEKDAKAAVEKRKKAIDETINGAYKKKTDAKKKRENIQSAVDSVKLNNSFGLLASADKIYKVARIERDGKSADMLQVRRGDDVVTISPKMFATMCEIKDDKQVVPIYKSMVALTKFANLWGKEAAKSVVSTDEKQQVQETTESVFGAFDDDRKVVFDFIVENLNSEMTKEEILSKAQSELTGEEVNIVNVMINDNYDTVKAGLDSLSGFLSKPKKETEKTEDAVEEQSDIVDVKKQVVNDKITEHAMKKYGRAKEEPEVSVEKETEPEIPVEKETEPEVSVTPVTNENAENEVVKSTDGLDNLAEGSYVDRIGILVNEIAALSKSRNELQQILGEEAKDQIDNINNAISDRLAKINELALSGIVSLGKDGDNKAVTEEVEEMSNEVEVVEQPVVESSVTDLIVPENANEVAIVDPEETTIVAPEEEITEAVVDAVEENDNARIVLNINFGNIYNAGGQFALIVGPGINVQTMGDENEVELEFEVPITEEDINDDIEDEVIRDEENLTYTESETGTEITNEVVDQVVTNEENSIYPGNQTVNEVSRDNTDEVVRNEGHSIYSGSETGTEVTNDVVVNNDFEESIDSSKDVVDTTAIDVEEDLEHRDAIAWWSMMAPILDDPEQQSLSRLNIARLEREQAAETAERTIDTIHFNEDREAFIVADKEARAAREEANRDRRARSILSAYGFDNESLDSMERGADAGEITPADFLDTLRANDEDTYNRIVSNYIEVKKNELRDISEGLTNSK